MPGAWEFPTRPNVLVATLTREIVSFKWAVSYRRMQLPSNSTDSGISGMPFDHGRNVACENMLNNHFTWCLRPDTLVETEGGPKEIRHVVVGDRVKTHKDRFRAVTKHLRRELKELNPLLWIKTKHSTIKCTPEHPFLVVRNGKQCFVRAEKLNTDDVLLYPDSIHKKDTVTIDVNCNTTGRYGNGLDGSVKMGRRIGTLEVDEGLARFMGLYLAEGCGGHDSIRFTIGNHESDLLEVLVGACRKYFGREPTVHRRWATTIKLNIRALAPVFTGWFGDDACTKCVPEFVFGWNLRNRLAFIRGYIEGDGSYEEVTWPFRTVSLMLVKGLTRLAASCGLAVKHTCTKASTSEYQGKEIRSKLAYVGWFSTKSVAKAKDLMDAWQLGDFLHVNIKAIEKHRVSSGLIDTCVYNLEVDEDNSYIADSVIVHNCFFLDDDVCIPPDTVPRLLAHGKDIVSGLYRRRAEPIAPVMLNFDARGQAQWITSWPPNALIEADLVGAGCLLIHRRVLERMKRPWFDWEIGKTDCLLCRGHPGHEGQCKMEGCQCNVLAGQPLPARLSEDFSFCRRAKADGFKIHVDTSIQCEHIGLGESRPDGTFAPSHV